jgi:MFS superfamily sulfate permease-like transporter
MNYSIRNHSALIVEWWAIELLSWAFSATCMAVIIGVLWIFDGKELPQLGFGLTINSFISLFSNLAKSAMILPTAEALGQLKWMWFRPGPNSLLDFEALDNASRGPWGSLVLLARSVLPQNSKVRRMYVPRITLGR